MTNKTFLKIAALILFAGLVYFIVMPKYSTAGGGHIKINRITGETYLLDGRKWNKIENEKKATLTDSSFWEDDATPVKAQRDF
jgi:hypothetical protein